MKHSNEMIEKVRMGLVNMKNKPDAFLFCDGWEEWTWDQKTICGIPVFHTESMVDARWQSSIEDILFIPIWNEEDDYITDRNDFIDGYADWTPIEKRVETANGERVETVNRERIKTANALPMENAF